MRQFTVFVKKEFLHIFRDARTILILLLMPVIQIVLFGFALTNEVKNVSIAIVKTDNNPFTGRAVNRLSSSGYFKIYGEYSNFYTAWNHMQRGEVSLIVSFMNGEANLTADGSDPNMASSILQHAKAILAREISENQIDNNLQSTLTTERVVPRVELLYNPQLKSAYNFVPGVMGLILMLICSMMTSISVVRERETGTMEVLLVSPVRPVYIILAKTVPYFVISMINLATILLLSVFLLGVPVTGSLFWLIFTALIFIFVSLSMGLLISSLASTQVAAMLISGLVFMMPVILLSGMIYPISNMPGILRFISEFIPAKWFISAVRKLMIQGLPIGFVIKEIGILLTMATFFVAVSLRAFKNRLE